MKNNISILKKEKCCGCLVCEDICPNKCIYTKIDSEGFIYPEIIEEKCIQCVACINVCPGFALEDTNVTNANNVIACYALNFDERNAGSSGGIFGVLARNIIKNGGKIYGAAFDEKLQVKHIGVYGETELVKIYKSKYIQSNTKRVWSFIKNDLEKGIIILFSGTPCQCKALRNFLKKDYSNLIVIDIICHGVPSQLLFNDYILDYEKRKRTKVKNYTFRYKSKNFYHERGYCIETEKGKIIPRQYYYSPYYYAYCNRLTLRPACYQCQWANMKRIGDITLGDFWGIEKYFTMERSGIGYSSVLLNTLKGRGLFKTIENYIFTKSLPVETIVANNECLSSPSSLNKDRSRFFADYNKFGFCYVRKKYMTPSFKYRLMKDFYFSLSVLLRKKIKIWLMK